MIILLLSVVALCNTTHCANIAHYFKYYHEKQLIIGNVCVVHHARRDVGLYKKCSRIPLYTSCYACNKLNANIWYIS